MRVVGSLTSIPKRLPHLKPVIERLVDQPLDRIYLNLPYRSRKGEEYQIPKDLLRYIQSEPKLILNRCKDIGPLTKLYPTLKKEKGKETRIITFDDDVLINSGVVEKLLSGSKKYPNSAIGFSGVCWGHFPFNYQVTSIETKDRKVDWLEGVYSVLYIRNFFDTKDLLSFPPRSLYNDYFHNDDHWISSYLASRNIDRWSLGYSTRSHFSYTSAKKIDSLSQRLPSLVGEHGRIIIHCQRSGYYYHQGTRLLSKGVYITFLVIIVLLILLWYFQ